MTQGETKIAHLLSAARIPYRTEHSFHDLKHGLFRFDFYLPQLNTCIEFQGIQHYVPNTKFFKTPADFRRAQGRDMAKIHYCLAHSIPLYVIPDWELCHIHTAADLFQDKYLAKTKYKNLDDYALYIKSTDSH